MFALDETIHCSRQAVLIIEVIADRGCMSEEQCANYYKISFVFFQALFFHLSLFVPWCIPVGCRMQSRCLFHCNSTITFVRDWKKKKKKWKPGNTRPPFSLKLASDSVVIISLLPRDITFLVSFAMKEMDLMRRSVSSDFFFWWWFLQAKAWR